MLIPFNHYFLEYIQPTYVNMHELANMAANKAQERNSQHHEPSSTSNFNVNFSIFNNLVNIFKFVNFEPKVIC